MSKEDQTCFATSRDRLAVPEGVSRVLLHSCCAPCSGEILEAMLHAGLDVTIFFYNPNIHPRDEYERRKQELIRFAQKLNVPFVDADYDEGAWFACVKGMEDEPERGKRCTACFSMRLERAALYAHDHGIQAFTTSLGISRLKNQDQVYACGRAASSRYEGLLFWDYNWRSRGGADRGAAIAKREAFYRQNYCGCAFSLRDAKKRQAEKEQN